MDPIEADAVLGRLMPVLQRHVHTIAGRIVDHASSGSSCISARLQAVCEAAGLPPRSLSSTLRADQTTDACGYIAADAAVKLRDAVMALGGPWLHAELGRYHTDHCVDRSNGVLGLPGGHARVLVTEDVNKLVHAYANLTDHLHAQEDWWGGAVALDHFVDGVGDFLQSSDRASMHQWRTWVVNTQTSADEGRHWFTVAIRKKGAAET